MNRIIQSYLNTEYDYTMYFDGAVEPKNPGGHVGYGFYIENKDKNIIADGSFYEEEHEHNTNNYAEHMGALEGMLKLKEIVEQRKSKKINVKICGDSMLVIKQLIGKWRIKEGYYVGAATKGFETARELERLCESVFFCWIPREQNFLADDYSIMKLVDKGIERKH